MHRRFDKVLIANRGEIALRVIRAAHELGLQTVAVYGTADRAAAHVLAADEAIYIGDERDGLPYLNIEQLLIAAECAGADAVHPGYGFLAERADFAEAVLAAGLVWVGPPPASMRAMAEKDTAKARAREVGVPVVPGVEGRELSDAATLEAAQKVGYPLLIKAVAGGGGRGMRVVTAEAELLSQVSQARKEAEAAFGDGGLLMERYVARGRHVEVQVLCDTHGNALHLHERECSVQRRHQKIVEEAPSPGLDDARRAEMCEQAVRLVASIGYVGAGTVEFLVDAGTGEHFFLEVNARIQVEHPVTEMITGVDLVQAQFRVAMGEALPWSQSDIQRRGHAIEVRLCAEDPDDGHRPQAGPVHRWRPPQAGVRVDAALLPRDEVSVFYDSMVAKLIVHAPDRESATRRLRRALDETELYGLANNRAFLAAILGHPAFQAGDTTTDFLTRYPIAVGAQPLSPPWWIAAALTRHRDSLSRRFRSNPARADVTALRRSGGEVAHVFLHPTGEGRWLAGVDVEPDEALMAPMEPTLEVREIASGDGWLRLEIQGYTATYRVCDVAGALWLTRPGHDAEALHEVSLLPEPATVEDAPGAVTSPSAAMVTEVHVAVGDEVQEGAPLVTVEAMKMLTVLRAPYAGVVSALECALGQSVSAGAALVSVSQPEA